MTRIERFEGLWAKIVENKYIPDNICLLESERQLAIIYLDTKECAVVDKPEPEMTRWEGKP